MYTYLYFSLSLFTRLRRPSRHSSFEIAIFIVDAPVAGRWPTVRLGAGAVAPPTKRWTKKRAKAREAQAPAPPGPASESTPAAPRPRDASAGTDRDTAPGGRRGVRAEPRPPLPPPTGRKPMQKAVAPASLRPCSPCLPVTISSV